ncbi:ABC transporter substrate-binding protein [Bacillus sp. FJAT-50079]|uniref:ABC transporter substrate-binding protein n=1 Tax=Bacillus sp. FJAT-50079 TaxID=2833577 RepID=UPI001BC95938|nr:ABC transporter substrate-binding protein [Bacillus sp. FJAT-50079]MBS4206687.1 carbohydrate ABC transporter substrate-binding protein [Bacillus sp. FJAT-50079]
MNRNIKKVFSLIALSLLVLMAGCSGGKETTQNEGNGSKSSDSNTFPKGKMVIYGYGQPQYTMEYYNNWLERNRDIAPEVEFEMVQTEGEADARQKVVTSFASGTYDDMADVIQTAPVSMIDMAEGGVLMDLTEFVKPFEDKLVDGALEQLTYKGKVYGLPDAVRPQVLFYNQEIFDKYNIDPKEMDTVEGYIEVGRKLKEASNGEVYLSYIDPGNLTWRYYGRRGFMPQANAKIWDDEGNIVIDKDPGARLAFETIETLVKEELVLKSQIMQAPLYDATRNGEVATYYIGAFWDEFIRKNLSDMEGKWRVMPAPMYQDIGKRGAPVTSMFAIVNKPEAKYADLFKELWEDFQFDAKERQVWTESMVQQDAPYANPIAKELLEDEFWKESSDFYGGQSFREMEGISLENGAENLRITTDDAEADQIISVELEKFIAGTQTMDEAIKNMGKNLRDKIGKTTPANE